MPKYFVFVPSQPNLLAFAFSPIHRPFESSQPELEEIQAENDIQAKRVFEKQYDSKVGAKLLKEVL